MAPDFSYRYFREPHVFSYYSAAPKVCDICGLSRPGYDGVFYGPVDIDFVCEVCLVGGRLAEVNASTNTASNLGDSVPSALAAERARELEQRTPLAATWQELVWPLHCGDFCCYLGEVGKPDLNALAPDGDGKAFFVAHLAESYGRDPQHITDIWDGIRPDTARISPGVWTIGVYLFQCLHCGQYEIEWDCD